MKIRIILSAILCCLISSYTHADWEQEGSWASPVTPASSGSRSGGGFALLMSEASGTTLGTNETAITPELEIAARALRNDPLRIYEFVRNEIHYNAPTYGIKLGAHGCLMAGQGNDWDQAALLSALLRISGVSTRYATSIVYYNTAMLSRWSGFGGNGDYNEVGGRVFYNGGWPTGTGTGTGDGWHAKYSQGNTEIWTGIRRIWVEADLDGQWVSLDPAFKDASISEVTHLASLMSYTQTNLLAEVLTGATTNANWVQNLNAGKLDTELTSLTTNLLYEIRENYDTEDIQALVGGRVFPREVITSFPSALPGAQDIASGSRTTFDHVPSARVLTLTVSYQNITNTFFGYELGGRPLTITHDPSASYSPKLWLDGDLIATGTSTTTGQTHTLNWSVDQPYSQAGLADDTYQQNLKSPGAYVLVYDFGSASRKRTLNAAQEFERLLASGVSPTSEAALLKAMNAAAAGGLEQWSLVRRMLGWVADSLNYSHHFLGVFGQEEGYFVDLPGIRSQNFPFSVDSSDWETSFKANNFFVSALEHGILEQTQGTNRPAVSTVKIMSENNAAGFKSFLANSANWTTVRAALTNYAPSVLTELDSRMDANSEIFLPEDGATPVSEWSGHGYAHFRSTTVGSTWSASMGMIISGGYNGAFAGSPGPYDVQANQNNFVNVVSSAPQEDTVVSTFAADPVDIRTGNMVHHKSLLELGRPQPRGHRLSVSYSSGEAARETKLGKGWRHSLDIQLTEGSDGAASFGERQASDAAALLAATYIVTDLLQDGAGPTEWATASLVTQWALEQMSQNSIVLRQGDRSLTYLCMPDGSFLPPPLVTSELIKTNGLYRLVERFGKEYRFNADHNIDSIVDADGNSMAFAYNAQTNLQTVTDAYGRALTFTYASDKLSQISDGTGRSVDLDYAGDNLTRITDPDGHEGEYQYNSQHQMTALIDPLDQVTASNIYNAVGQVVTQFNDHGQAWAMFSSGSTGTEVDPEGGTKTHHFDKNGRNLRTEDPLGNWTYKTYTPRGMLSSSTDELGHETHYQYDSQYNLTNRMDALSNEWSYGYDSGQHLVTEIDPLGRSTQYEYNDTHHLTKIVDSLMNETVLTYYTSGSHKGLPHTVTDPDESLSSTTYDSYGNVQTLSRTDSGTVTNTWNARGDLLVSRDALGNPTTITYNKRRQPTSITDALGNVVSNMYDAVGYQTAVIDPLSNQTDTVWTPTYKRLTTTYPNGGVVSNFYDSRDWVTATTDMQGNVISNLYDSAGRLTGTLDTLDRETNFHLDKNGNITNAVVDPAGLNLWTQTQFDELDRPVSVQTALSTVQRQFDAVSQLTNRIDGAAKEWKTQYDSLGRVKKTVRPSGSFEEYDYDAVGNRIAFRNAAFKPTTYGFDGQGRVTAITNAINEVTTFTYDEAGNLRTRTDAEGVDTFYGYDSLNRLTTVTNQSVEVASFDHDDNGNIILQSNPVSHASFSHDAMNRISAVTQSVSSVQSVVTNSYDLNGNRTNIVYPGGLEVGYEYGDDNRLTKVLVSETSGPPSEFTFVYDGAGRKTNIVYPNSVNATFGYDAENRITSIQHGSFIDRTIQRNVLGFKETELIDAGLKPTAPETGRRTKTHNDADQLVSEWVQLGTNETTVSYAYHDNGGLFQTSKDGIPETQYEYDYADRLESVSLSTDVEYLHDASGARIGRIENSVTNYFVVDYVDGLKRPLAETDANGTVTRYYVWVGMHLLCHIEADGTTRYYHADELGSTLALTDESGTVTDQFAYMPYGYANHSGSTETPYQWLGGYGLYYDTQTDLHLTLHRAYSSTQKRFISADPLGIDGGVNVYAMANRNPLAFIDPYGLSGADSYLSRSWEQVWQGNYTENVTALGTVGQIATGVAGIDAPGDIRDLTHDIQNWENSWSHVGKTLLDGVGLVPVVGAFKYADEAKTLFKGSNKIPTPNRAPDFVVSPGGTAYPVPKGATGPTPVINPGGKQTGSAFTGGAGGANGQVSTMRIMDPAPPRGSSPGYPNGYIKYENSAVPHPQGVNPYTGQTVAPANAHFPIDP